MKFKIEVEDESVTIICKGTVLFYADIRTDYMDMANMLVDVLIKAGAGVSLKEK